MMPTTRMLKIGHLLPGIVSISVSLREAAPNQTQQKRVGEPSWWVGGVTTSPPGSTRQGQEAVANP